MYSAKVKSVVKQLFPLSTSSRPNIPAVQTMELHFNGSFYFFQTRSGGSNAYIGYRPIFLGAEPYLPEKKYFDSAHKTAHLTLPNATTNTTTMKLFRVSF